MSRLVVVSESRPWPDASGSPAFLEQHDATEADLVEYLQARPDLALAVVEGLAVAGSWSVGTHSAARAAIGVHRLEVNRSGGEWLWEAYIPRLVSRAGHAETQDAAMTAVDEVLLAAGVSLAGGVHGGAA